MTTRDDDESMDVSLRRLGELYDRVPLSPRLERRLADLAVPEPSLLGRLADVFARARDAVPPLPNMLRLADDQLDAAVAGTAEPGLAPAPDPADTATADCDAPDGDEKA